MNSSRVSFGSPGRLAVASTLAVSIALVACGSPTTKTGTPPITSTPGSGSGAPGAPASTAGGSNPSALPVIHLGGGAAHPTATGGPVADSSMRIRPGSVIYVFTGSPLDSTLPPGGTAPSWSFPPNPTIDGPRVAKLAAAFGVTGDATALPSDQGGGKHVGPLDGSAPNLTVYGDATGSWYFNPGMSGQGGVVSSPACGGSDQAVPPNTTMVLCSAPKPPAGVPTKDEAITKATALLSAAGYDLGGYSIDAIADQWTASMTATLLIGGQQSPLVLRVAFGGGGQVVSATGFLATPQSNAAFPLVGAAAGLKRLNDEGLQWMTSFGGGVPIDARAGVTSSTGGGTVPGGAVTNIVPAPGPATRVCPTLDGGNGSDVTLAAPTTESVIATPITAEGPPTPLTTPGPTAPPTIEPPLAPPTTEGPTAPPSTESRVILSPTTVSDGLTVPPTSDVAGSSAGGSPGFECPPGGLIGDDPNATMPAAEPITVTLTAVRLGMTGVYASDGTFWLLPAYVFIDVNSVDYTVLAIDDQFLALDQRVVPAGGAPIPAAAGAATAASSSGTPVTTAG